MTKKNKNADADLIRQIKPGEHFVQFYDETTVLIDSIYQYFVGGFEAGEVAIMIATRAHRLALEVKFLQAGYDLDALKASGKYAPFDAAESLGLFMVKGRPDRRRFCALVGALMAAVAEKGIGVRAYGEMVSVLWDENNIQGAIELERLWNDLARSHSFTLFCAYRNDQFSDDDLGLPLQCVCAAHSRVIGDLRPTLR